MATNNFLPFCSTDTGINLLSQADYAASPYLLIGNQPGVASSQLSNKTLRQASAIVSQVAQAVSDITGLDMLDVDSGEAALLLAIKQAFQSPVGTIQAFGGAAAPTGWLLCNGASLLRAGTYAPLFAILGTTYGAADGTHFNVPDLRGIFARGAGTNGTLLNSNGAAFAGTLGTYQNDKFQGHRHSTSGTQFMSAGPGGTGDSGGGAALFVVPVITDPSADGSNGAPRTGAETNPANLGVTYIIKI